MIDIMTDNIIEEPIYKIKEEDNIKINDNQIIKFSKENNNIILVSYSDNTLSTIEDETILNNEEMFLIIKTCIKNKEIENDAKVKAKLDLMNDLINKLYKLP